MTTRRPGGDRDRRGVRRDQRGGRPPRGPQQPRQPEQPAPGSYHYGERARDLLRQGMERHGCATARELADRLGVPYGPRLLTAIGYRGAAGPAWQELAPALEAEDERGTTEQEGSVTP